MSSTYIKFNYFWTDWNFLKWFLSTREREVSPWREFYEELVLTNILDKKIFGYVFYEMVGQHFEPIHYDKFAKMDAFMYADIFVPRFINQDQIDSLKKLLTIQSNDFIWATEEEIRKKETSRGEIILPHSVKIFHTKMLTD